MRHAMTIDVEDYFQVSALAEAIRPEDWSNWPLRVEQNTQVLLDLFATQNLKATFFVLGWVAERCPSLVRSIVESGHELASHGYSHQLVYRQSESVFKEETLRSKRLLEDIGQVPVTGYRAASYSITRETPWAPDILCELGFEWDSSIFPIHHDRYGVPGSPEDPYWLEAPSGGRLREYPLTTAKVAGMNVPAAGGGYFRQYPYALSRALFRRASEGARKPLLFYLHPWEIDPEQPKVPGLSWKSRFRHYTNLHRCLPRLERLIQDFEFTTVSQAMASLELKQRFRIT